ncbi:thiamine pyrophosphate-dependent enzyme [Roseococcus suduntuyensis]|uniref:Thiamine pyrophosphate-dependent acetolactate synthase large subunit-like protein n=1 Tax=Roseococcus suduntuyensis TaxID=455361 RepID=A0A840AA27_9PROT|nr:thiamine pyrophosphate-dependent enzyme [Roseococcus suduntuyensis]MBB3898888.1 thiamine pyrophosphate-dependent acetolactate synthase large subunit-like protein [Roseococcus suduntuyensis]
MTRPETLRSNTQVMNRAALTKRIVGKLHRREAVVGGIGNSNWDLWAADPARPENFYMLGSMGLAAPIALGVALAQPDRRVLALEGDGSLLMQLGCLSTIAARAPRNLVIVVWDNAIYQITGGQPTPAAQSGTDWVAIARASGIAQSHWAADEAEFDALIETALTTDGPHLIAARIDDEPGRSQTDRDPVRFAQAFARAMALPVG